MAMTAEERAARRATLADARRLAAQHARRVEDQRGRVDQAQQWLLRVLREYLDERGPRAQYAQQYQALAHLLLTATDEQLLGLVRQAQDAALADFPAQVASAMGSWRHEAAVLRELTVGALQADGAARQLARAADDPEA